MKKESPPLEQVEGSSPSPLEKLDKAAKMRAEAAQLIAVAEKLEADQARATKEDTLRDYRIIGTAAMQLAEASPDLARVLVEGVGACKISGHDRKFLGRDGSALEQLRKIVEAQTTQTPVPDPTPAPGLVSPASPTLAPTLAWFDVPFVDKDRVPPGVLYDPETKARCAISRHVVEQMRALGFNERQDLAGRPPPTRN